MLAVHTLAAAANVNRLDLLFILARTTLRNGANHDHYTCDGHNLQCECNNADWCSCSGMNADCQCQTAQQCSCDGMNVFCDGKTSTYLNCGGMNAVCTCPETCVDQSCCTSNGEAHNNVFCVNMEIWEGPAISEGPFGRIEYVPYDDARCAPPAAFDDDFSNPGTCRGHNMKCR